MFCCGVSFEYHKSQNNEFTSTSLSNHIRNCRILKETRSIFPLRCQGRAQFKCRPPTGHFLSRTARTIYIYTFSPQLYTLRAHLRRRTRHIAHQSTMYYTHGAARHFISLSLSGNNPFGRSISHVLNQIHSARTTPPPGRAPHLKF